MAPSEGNNDIVTQLLRQRGIKDDVIQDHSYVSTVLESINPQISDGELLLTQLELTRQIVDVVSKGHEIDSYNLGLAQSHLDEAQTIGDLRARVEELKRSLLNDVHF